MQRNSNMEFVREARTALIGTVTYEVIAGELGAAAWVDISRVGVRVALGRYLRPGRVIAVAFTAPGNYGTQVSLQARVVWCLQAGNSAEFHAGLQVVRDNPAAALAFAWLLQDARDAANKADSGAVVNTVWPMFRQFVDRQPQPEAAEYVPRAV